MAARRLLTEFIGTFFLVLTVGLVIKGGKTDEPFVLAPLAIGSILMVMVYMGGHISGGHYNPAVSLAVWLRGAIEFGFLLLYWAAQFLGAIVAAVAVHAILHKNFAPSPASDVSIINALIIEFLFTFALALVVLNVATLATTEGNSYFGLAIGFTIFAGAVGGGGISGGAFNPAVGVGPIIVDALLAQGGWGNIWLYLVGPLAGGAVAALIFRMQNAIWRK